MLRRFGGKLSAVFILAILLPAYFSSLARAESGNLGGKPAHPDPNNSRTNTIFIKTIEPGGSGQDAVEVINNTGEQKNVMVYAVDSVRSSGGAFACSQAADPIKDAGGWIKVARPEVALESGQKTIIDFKISAPKSADPGEHNACIVIQEKTSGSLVQSGIGLSFRTAIRVAILVPGDIVKKLTATGISTQTKDKEVDITAKVKSESNVSLDTTLKAELRPFFYGNGEHQSNTFPVLRGDEAEWNFSFKRPFWGGFYKAGFTASYNPDTTLTLGEKGDGRMTEVSGPTKNIFIWPQPLALAIELLVIALGLFILLMIPEKIIAKRRIKKNWIDYRVKAGETVVEIANRTGVRWKKLAKINDLKAPYNLVPGSVIRVPRSKTTPTPNDDLLQNTTAAGGQEEMDKLGADEPNMLKEEDVQTESVEEIFEDDDIPGEEIAAELSDTTKGGRSGSLKKKKTKPSKPSKKTK